MLAPPPLPGSRRSVAGLFMGAFRSFDLPISAPTPHFFFSVFHPGKVASAKHSSHVVCLTRANQPDTYRDGFPIINTSATHPATLSLLPATRREDNESLSRCGGRTEQRTYEATSGVLVVTLEENPAKIDARRRHTYPATDEFAMCSHMSALNRMYVCVIQIYTHLNRASHHHHHHNHHRMFSVCGGAYKKHQRLLRPRWLRVELPCVFGGRVQREGYGGL